MRQRKETKTNTHLLKIIGQKIVYYRNAIGITQTELGIRIKVSRFQMCKHEAGTAELPITRLFLICEALRVAPNDFMRVLTKTLKS